MVIDILLLTALAVYPSLRPLGDVYYGFCMFVYVLILLILISLSHIRIEIKVILLLIIIYYYHRLIILGSTFLLTYFDLTSKESYTDSLVRSCVKDMYSNVFYLKSNFEKIPSTPSIIVANYCSDRLENMACILIPRKVCVLMRDTLLNIVRLDKIIKWPILVKKEGTYEDIKKQVIDSIKEGRFIFSYVSKTPRIGPYYIQNMRSGMFRLAMELGIQVTPITFDYIEFTHGSIPKQKFEIKVGDSFYVKNIHESVLKVKKYFQTCIKEFERTKHLYI